MAPPLRLLTHDQKLAWLRLIRTDNVGPVTFRQLINRAGSAEAALADLPRLASRAGTAARIPSLAQAEDEMAAVERSGGRMVASGEPEYPLLLNHIPAAPPLITLRGGRRLDLNHTVAIVGARNASASGQRLAQTLAADLGAAGYCIISGLARGIDAAAHKAALPTGTLAVLAGGLDRIYPEENIPLAEAIVDAGGVLLTEMPMGWSPRAQDFPRRNRLVSGLSLGVVVVEAARRSGSLITARLALEQNRDVFAVPGSPLDPRAEGGNHLIRQGAHLVTSAADIVEVVAAADPTRLPLFEAEWEPEISDIVRDVEPTQGERAKLLEALSPTPTAVDDVVIATGLGVPTVQTLLLELDLAGRLEWSSGQLVALRP